MAITNPTALAPYIRGARKSSVLELSVRVQSAGAATNQPDFQIPSGVFASATHASTGVYTFTLDNYAQYGTLISAHAEVLGSASSQTDGRDCRVVSYSSGVLTVHVYSSGKHEATAADPALAAIKDNDWLMLDLVFAQDVGNEGTAGALAVTA